MAESRRVRPTANRRLGQVNAAGGPYAAPVKEAGAIVNIPDLLIRVIALIDGVRYVFPAGAGNGRLLPPNKKT